MGAQTWEPESGRKAPLSCNATFSMLQCNFSFVAVQLLVKNSKKRHPHCRKANVPVQALPKVAAQLLFLLVASCRV